MNKCFHLRQDKLLTELSQESYFKGTVAKLFEPKKPNQILFSYLKNDICIGYGRFSTYIIGLIKMLKFHLF